MSIALLLLMKFIYPPIRGATGLSILVLTALTLGLYSCGKNEGLTLSGAQPPNAPGLPAPAPSSGVIDEPSQGLWATFKVGGESFNAVIMTELAQSQVTTLWNGGEAPQIPIGKVVAGGKTNFPWSWHLAPETMEFAQLAPEACDGKPSHIQRDVDKWAKNQVEYCPWHAKLTDLKDCRSGSCRPIDR